MKQSSSFGCIFASAGEEEDFRNRFASRRFWGRTDNREDRLTTQAFLTLERVLERVPYSRTEWYRGIKEGRFPKPYRRRPDKPESRGVCWSEKEVEQVIRWIESGRRSEAENSSL